MSIIRYTIPNSFTALSLLFGIASIVTTQLGELEFAAWLIVWCGLLDTMDGVAARLLKATSSFGAEFDSMADLIAFGVAPAILVLNVGLKIGGIEVESGQFWVLLVSVGMFVLAGAIRLARFNLPSSTSIRGWFTGVPITVAGGGLISSMVIVMIHYEEKTSALPLHLYLPTLMFVLAILMVSTLRFPKTAIRKSMIINAFQLVTIIAVFYCGIFRVYPEYLFSIGIFLLVTGTVAGFVTRDKPGESKTA